MTVAIKQSGTHCDAVITRTASAPVTQRWRHPISRWYLLPAVDVLAALLSPTRVRPTHITLANAALGLTAAATLMLHPAWSAWAAVLLWMAWACDRLDGALARRQQTTSRWGAWLDANIDELLDVAIQLAVAIAAIKLTGQTSCWWLFAAFMSGKYLFACGLQTEHASAENPNAPASLPHSQNNTWLHTLYHLPGNADIRVHLTLAALLASQLSPYVLIVELAVVAGYYNFRWMARYRLVARRLKEAA